jgi:hypothetical protein
MVLVRRNDRLTNDPGKGVLTGSRGMHVSAEGQQGQGRGNRGKVGATGAR